MVEQRLTWSFLVPGLSLLLRAARGVPCAWPKNDVLRLTDDPATLLTVVAMYCLMFPANLEQCGSVRQIHRCLFPAPIKSLRTNLPGRAQACSILTLARLTHFSLLLVLSPAGFLASCLTVRQSRQHMHLTFRAYRLTLQLFPAV